MSKRRGVPKFTAGDICIGDRFVVKRDGTVAEVKGLYRELGRVYLRLESARGERFLCNAAPSAPCYLRKANA